MGDAMNVAPNIFEQGLSQSQSLTSEDRALLTRMQTMGKGEVKVINMVKISPRSKAKKPIDLPIKTTGISTIREEDHHGSKV